MHNRSYCFVNDNNSAREHILIYHNAVESTCTENGTVEYLFCSECGKIFADKDGIAEISNITVSATGHN